MIKRICNHCGKIYTAERPTDKCPCQKQRRTTYTQHHKEFYDSIHWKALAKEIKARDLYTDRLALYINSQNSPVFDFYLTGGINILINYLKTPTGKYEANKGILIVHHIQPINEEPELRYKKENLITLNKHTHEWVHQIYKTKEKEALQKLLQNAVDATL